MTRSNIGFGLVGIILGISSVVAGSTSAAPAEPVEVACDDQLQECQSDLTEALTGWTACIANRKVSVAELRSCRATEGVGDFASRRCEGLNPNLERLIESSGASGVNHRELLELVRLEAKEFTVPEAASFELAVVEEFARRAPTAEPKVIDEMTTALDGMRTQVAKTETLLKAAAAVQ